MSNPKSVATAASVVPIPSTATSFGGTTGAWTPGAIVMSSYSQLTIGKAPILYQVTCTFEFKSGTTLVASDPVVLTASSTHLMGAHSSVLRTGDSKKSTNGNAINIVSSVGLRSD